MKIELQFITLSSPHISDPYETVTVPFATYLIMDTLDFGFISSLLNKQIKTIVRFSGIIQQNKTYMRASALFKVNKMQSTTNQQTYFIFD